MSDYLVSDTELTETADAIRAKTGESGLIEWESGTGFADAVAAISGGGVTKKEITTRSANQTYIEFSITANDTGWKLATITATDGDHTKYGIYDADFCTVSNTGSVVGTNNSGTDNRRYALTPIYSATQNANYLCITASALRLTRPGATVPFVVNREYKLTLYYW